MAEERAEHLVYTVTEAGRLLRLSRGTTYQAIREGKIPSVRIGRRILIPCKLLENLLQQEPTDNDGG